jgi:uncharacterized protein YjiS (DUF1127 family)
MNNTGMKLSQLLRLWRARHRHRHELAMMSGGDLKNARLSTDLVAHEIRKWPWQPFNSQWPGLDAALLRGIEARQPRRERRPLLPGRAFWQMWRRNRRWQDGYRGIVPSSTHGRGSESI